MDEDAEWNKNKSDQQMGAEGNDSIETLANTVKVSLDLEYIITHNKIFQKKSDTPSFPYLWLMNVSVYSSIYLFLTFPDLTSYMPAWH